MKTKSSLSYFGSDSEVASQLATLLDHCKHVSIPFAGGLAILPHLKARAIVANDLNRDAIRFYKTLAGWYGGDQRSQLVELCNRTLSHPEELEIAARLLAYGETPMLESMARLSWAYWALCWLGRKGKGGTSSLLKQTNASVRRTPTGGNNASRLKSVKDDLLCWAREFERCEFECNDFRSMLGLCADLDICGIYCDSPWPAAGKAYAHSFVEKDHIDLRDSLTRFARATVLVRNEDSPFIRELYRDWRIIPQRTRTQANTDCGELWILNKEPRK